MFVCSFFLLLSFVYSRELINPQCEVNHVYIGIFSVNSCSICAVNINEILWHVDEKCAFFVSN